MEVNLSFYSPPWEKNIVNVRNLMALSKIHEISYIRNGETYVLPCSVTVKIMKFLQEKVKTKKNDHWERLDWSHESLSQDWRKIPPFTMAF